MKALRSKIIISLILMSFISIALTTLIARGFILQRFEDLAVDPVAEHFATDVMAYYREYGSWEAALETEHIFEFVQRKRALGELSNPPGVYPPLPPAPFPQANDGPQGMQGPPGRPPVPLDENGLPLSPPAPPLPYLVLNINGQVVMAPPDEAIGRFIPQEEINNSITLTLDGELIGYLYSESRVALVQQERQYLEAISDSWWITLILASLLAIPFGYFLGLKLAKPIDSLDKAIRSMQPGALEQRVPVTTQDELGHLTSNFNQMSSDLAQAYDELEESRQKMEEMSLQDPLTLLPNRRSFDESAAVVLAQAYRHNRSCVLAMIDVDRFKQINDSYSHSIGDQVLQLLSRVLKDNLREVDILARYGGEEFLVLFPETDLKTAHTLMERIRETIAEHSWPEVDSDLRITISAGLVEVDVNETSANPLEKALSAADKKLYLAKDSGRNRIES